MSLPFQKFSLRLRLQAQLPAVAFEDFLASLVSSTLPRLQWPFSKMTTLSQLPLHVLLPSSGWIYLLELCPLLKRHLHREIFSSHPWWFYCLSLQPGCVPFCLSVCPLSSFISSTLAENLWLSALLYSQCPEQCLVYSWHSINICWNECINK